MRSIGGWGCAAALKPLMACVDASDFPTRLLRFARSHPPQEGMEGVES